METPTIDLLHPDRDALLNKWKHLLEVVSPLNKWDLPEELAWWAEYATRCTDILELGAYNGASTLIMLLANPEVKISVIDLWEDAGTMEAFLKATEEYRLNGRLDFSRDTTENGLRQLLEDRTIAFDGLLIDAGHTKELVWSDIVLGMQLMKPGTLIMGHDYHPSWHDNGVSQAVIELLPGHTNPIASIWAYRMPDTGVHLADLPNVATDKDADSIAKKRHQIQVLEASVTNGASYPDIPNIPGYEPFAKMVYPHPSQQGVEVTRIFFQSEHPAPTIAPFPAPPEWTPDTHEA